MGGGGGRRGVEKMSKRVYAAALKKKKRKKDKRLSSPGDHRPNGGLIESSQRHLAAWHFPPQGQTTLETKSTIRRAGSTGVELFVFVPRHPGPVVLPT